MPSGNKIFSTAVNVPANTEKHVKLTVIIYINIYSKTLS